MGFWHKFADIAKRVGPSVLEFVPGVPPLIIPLIVHGINAAEAIPGADGPTKKAAALALVTDGLTGLNAVKGEMVIDPAVIIAASSQGIDSVIAAINEIKKAHAALALQAAEPPAPPTAQQA